MPRTVLDYAGPYRWSRNPQYVGWLLFVLGFALNDWSLWCLASCTPQSSESFDILVWADESTTEGPYPEGRLLPGPCGPRVLRSVGSLNDLAPGERQTLERVLEFTDSHEIVAAWQIPVDVVPQATSGEWLIVGRAGKYMAISPDGQLRRTAIPRDAAEPRHEGSCPDRVRNAYIGTAGESGYIRCWTVADVSTGASRHIVFAGPCT